MHRVKLIRLVSGEDILCNIVEEDYETLFIENPLMISLKFKNKESSISMGHWLPIEILKDNRVCLTKNNIICLMEPSDSLIEYYLNMMEKMYAAMIALEKSKNLEEDLDNMNDVMLALEESQNSILH